MKLRRLPWTIIVVGLSAGLLLAMWVLRAQAQEGTSEWENRLPQGNELSRLSGSGGSDVSTLVMPRGLGLGAGPAAVTADENPDSTVPGPMHKVIAAPGLLDRGAEGVTLWHDYGSYALYLVSDAALEGLSAEVRSRITVASDMDRLAFDAFPIDTRMPGVGAQIARDASGASGPALHLIQFVGPIKSEWLEAVAVAGATPIQYIATNGYLVWADGVSRAKLSELVESGEFLQFGAPYPPSLKVGPALAARENPDDVVPVVIQMYRHDGWASSEAAIQNLAVDQLSGWTPILKFQNIIITLAVRDVNGIASLPDVFWIEERLERRLLDEVQGQILAGNFNFDQSGPADPGYLTWLNSYGFSTNPGAYPIVDVTDDGIGNGTVNSGDPTLHQFGDIVNPTRLAYVANCTDSADGGGPSGHGHINTSIVGGYDTRSGFPFQDPLGYQRGLGINPYGRMAGTRVFDPNYDQSSCGGSDIGVIKSIQDNGALINTNSWGCPGCAGTYDDSSQAYDAGVRDADLTQPGNQELIIVFSAGNSGPSSGTVSTPGNGKNMITVGVSENQRPSDEDGAWTDGCGFGPTSADDAMDIINISSRGPAPGSRVKPEVVAPGTHIQGTASTHPSYNGSGLCDQYRPSGQTVFAASSGTSHSTPAVAGVASLAYWWMENTYGVTIPSPAAMKAYLIAHPTYLTGVGANDTLPSNSQGYGMPNMAAMFDDASKYLLDQSVTFDNSGETWTWQGAVADATKPVRIVLAYTDAPGAIGTSPQVNNLNLTADVDGTAYLGNVFSGQWSVTGGAADPFNNYEAIFLPPGTDGSIEITVTGFNIAGDGVPNSGDGTDQDFALVCYNCAQAVTMDCNRPAVDFEDGIPADWTVVNNSPGGIVWVTTADPACGIPNWTNGSGEAACADSDAAGFPAVPYDTELVSNPFDLSAVGAAVLDVKAYYKDITSGTNDHFEVDVWDGASWTNELSWDENHMPEDFSRNLSAYAGLPTVQVRFRYFGDGYDWYAQVDDIALTCVPIGPPAIEVDPAALTESQGPDVVSTQPMTITNSGGSPLNWSIIEDDTACDSPIDIPWLSVAPNAGTTVPLASTVVDVTFDSTGLVPGDYTANLCVESDDAGTPLVQVLVALAVESPDLLLCNGEMIQFEDGIPSGWQVVDNTGGAGIVWTTTADPACEIGNMTNGTGEAACADSAAGGFPGVPYDTELVSNLFDLSVVGAAVLEVKAYYRDISTGANDRFEVDVWDGASWTNELSWDEDHMPEDFTLDLSAYVGLPTVQVRFRYFGNGYDWYAQVDDIALACVPFRTYLPVVLKSYGP